MQLTTYSCSNNIKQFVDLIQGAAARVQLRIAGCLPDSILGSVGCALLAVGPSIDLGKQLSLLRACTY
jgi:hypothetical protein